MKKIMGTILFWFCLSLNANSVEAKTYYSMKTKLMDLSVYIEGKRENTLTAISCSTKRVEHHMLVQKEHCNEITLEVNENLPKIIFSDNKEENYLSRVEKSNIYIDLSNLGIVEEKIEHDVNIDTIYSGTEIQAYHSLEDMELNYSEATLEEIKESTISENLTLYTPKINSLEFRIKLEKGKESYQILKNRFIYFYWK